MSSQRLNQIFNILTQNNPQNKYDSLHREYDELWKKFENFRTVTNKHIKIVKIVTKDILNFSAKKNVKSVKFLDIKNKYVWIFIIITTELIFVAVMQPNVRKTDQTKKENLAPTVVFARNLKTLQP
jgi:hypothetical protein